MFCAKCGREINDNAKFCAGCGNKIDFNQTVEIDRSSPVSVSNQPNKNKKILKI